MFGSSHSWWSTFCSGWREELVFFSSIDEVAYCSLDEFKSIDFKKMMKKSNFKLFDMRNIYSIEKMKKDKIKYFSIGR